MPPEPTNAEKISKLKWAYLWSATNTVFTQFTVFGTVFVLFLNALNVSKTGIGFLLSFMPFFGLVALFISPAVKRFGFKRTFVTFWGLRKAAVALLLLTPWVLQAAGAGGAAVFVGVVLAIFAICRAVGETGHYPWLQEYVPHSLLGKFTATDNRVIAASSFVSVISAGFVLERANGLSGFMSLIAAGVLFGFAAVWASSKLPGGAPRPAEGESRNPLAGLAAPARDPVFRRHLLGVALVTLGLGPVGAFLPLFLSEQVGLSASQVVWTQTGGMIGGLVSSFLWGWAADRYGSKPVMLSALGLMALMPALWLLLPRQSALSFGLAFGVIFLSGLVGLGWTVGVNRQLFVNLVPAEHKTPYLSLNYAWGGVVGGISQVAGGRLLDITDGLAGRLGPIHIDPYSVLFAAGIVLPLAAGLLLRRVRSDSGVSVGGFAGMFLHGNPLLAAESLIAYGRPMDERATVRVTARLGQARSRLTVEELLEALADPRFNVRFEAMIAMTKVPTEPRLIEALGAIVSEGDPAMSVIAAWALGRLGDARAIPLLRQGLVSRYRSVQAYSVRALGTLNDEEITGRLVERFLREEDDGLRLAYASALGKLHAVEATGPLLDFLRGQRESHIRTELALVLARLVGGEPQFIQLWRAMRAEAGTAVSVSLTGLKKKLHGRPALPLPAVFSRVAGAGGAAPADAAGNGPGTNGAQPASLAEALDAAADLFARDRLDEGALALAEVVESALGLAGPAAQAAPEGAILRECAHGLRRHGAARQEYILLALHALHALPNHEA